MSEILFINACVRPESRTMDLAQHLIEKMNGNLQRVDLYDAKIHLLIQREWKKDKKQ